jgi:TM2 domain-containing membrane protein YozV
MKNIFSKISLLAVVLGIATSCSKTPYATFGGGPRRLTAEPRKYVAAQNPDQSGVKAVTMTPETVVPVSQEPVLTSKAIRKAISKVEKSQAVASTQKLSFSEKISLARKAYQLKREVEKVENQADANKTTEGGKSQIIALILVFFLGGIGIHRFYLGYTWQGVVQLLTAGGCGIWALIDFIRIITGNLKPKDGEYDQTL